jgi:hypothetical protein
MFNFAVIASNDTTYDSSSETGHVIGGLISINWPSMLQRPILKYFVTDRFECRFGISFGNDRRTGAVVLNGINLPAPIATFGCGGLKF